MIVEYSYPEKMEPPKICKECSKIIPSNSLTSFCSKDCLEAFAKKVFDDLDGRN